LVEQIKKLVIEGTLNGIDNIYNKSDKKRLLIDIECEGNPATILRKLYKETDLQKSYSANQFALVGKTPSLLTLKEYLDIYIQHNYDCIVRQYTYECQQAENRKEIVEGLLIALRDIDEVIKIIRASESAKDAVKNLWEKFPLNERQAKAIVDMKLGRLAHLEQIELQDELGELKKKIDYCRFVIESKDEQRNLFLADLSDFVKKYPNPRKTAVTQVTEQAVAKEIVDVEPEKCVVVFTESGLIKRVPHTSFKVQKRNGVGVKTQDAITKAIIRTNTIDSLMVFTSKGKMYRILVDDIPVGTNSSKGVMIQTLIEMEPDEKPTLVYSMYYETDATYVTFVTKRGIIKKTPLDEYTKTKKKSGIAAINLREGDSLASVNLMKDEQLLMITKNGMSIRIRSTDVSPSGRATIGIKGMTVAEDDEVIAALPIREPNDQVAVFTTGGLGKRIKLTEFVTQTRGGKGIICYKPTNATGVVTAAALVDDTDTLLVTGTPKAICINAKDVSIIGRAGIGVQIIKGNITSVSKI
jgi:DNA gyrase subunit A